MTFRLTPSADADIDRILTETLELFGPLQVSAYAAIIQSGLDLVGDDPHAIGTRRRDDIAPKVRMLHLDRAAKRRGAAAHSLYFLPAGTGSSAETIVLRVLHERMDPKARIADTLTSRTDPVGDESE